MFSSDHNYLSLCFSSVIYSIQAKNLVYNNPSLRKTICKFSEREMIYFCTQSISLNIIYSVTSNNIKWFYLRKSNWKLPYPCAAYMLII
jgi:hypothetical protein